MQKDSNLDHSISGSEADLSASLPQYPHGNLSSGGYGGINSGYNSDAGRQTYQQQLQQGYQAGYGGVNNNGLSYDPHQAAPGGYNQNHQNPSGLTLEILTQDYVLLVFR